MKYGVGADFGFRPATEQEQEQSKPTSTNLLTQLNKHL
jgi:hypothetical protein